ncbi:hypothetical protein C8Q77DRAFT_704625 [Trametes polyzona]|nr:hypothetical protein C8Q77DRAFT_704625 [Trametes polyzona]
MDYPTTSSVLDHSVWFPALQNSQQASLPDMALWWKAQELEAFHTAMRDHWEPVRKRALEEGVHMSDIAPMQVERPSKRLRTDAGPAQQVTAPEADTEEDVDGVADGVAEAAVTQPELQLAILQAVEVAPAEPAILSKSRVTPPPHAEDSYSPKEASSDDDQAPDDDDDNENDSDYNDDGKDDVENDNDEASDDADHNTHNIAADDNVPANKVPDVPDVPFTCGWDGCTTHAQNKKAWYAHMRAVHRLHIGSWANKPPASRLCRHPDCHSTKPHSSWGILTKHYRQYHQSPGSLVCANTWCKREGRPFNDRSSLIRHVRRCKDPGTSSKTRKRRGSGRASAASSTPGTSR